VAYIFTMVHIRRTLIFFLVTKTIKTNFTSTISLQTFCRQILMYLINQLRFIYALLMFSNSLRMIKIDRNIWSCDKLCVKNIIYH